MLKLKHHEFWPARWYELPGYIWLALHSVVRGIGLKSLLKANYGLDHGGASFASKFSIQQHIGKKHFPATILLPAEVGVESNQQAVQALATQHGYPIIMKPDYGFTGRGVFKIDNEQQLRTLMPFLQIDYLAQAFVPSQVEFGVFYVRYRGQPHIIGINQKHFPTVIGDGKSTLQQLVSAHPRHNHFWDSYLPYHDLGEVLPADEKKRLSVIGSHTMGCMFTDDTNLLTPELEQAVFKIFADTPGFNYGRLDLLAASTEAFQRGDFTMVEANGVDALPTNIFDPKINVWQSYRILFFHFEMLAKIGAEHKRKPAQLLPLRAFIRKSRNIMRQVETQQDHLETMPDIHESH